GPGLYFLLRARGKGILAWVIVPALAVVAAALAPLYRVVLDRSESAVVSASIVEADLGGGVSLESTDALVLSGGREQHDVRIRGDDVAAHSVLPPGLRRPSVRAGPAIGWQRGRNALEFPLDVPLWGSRYVAATIVRPSGVAVSGRGLSYIWE